MSDPYIIPPYLHRRRTLGTLGKAGTLGQPPSGPAILAPFGTHQADDEDTKTRDPRHRSRPDLPPWIYPPANFESIDKINYVLLPAINSTAIIISYVLPPGRNGLINKVACNFVGGGWVEGTGDVIWRILIDGTPPPGATDYDTVLASLGSPAQPTGITGFRAYENQVLTLVAFNNPSGPNGGVIVSGQRVGGRLTGYNYPREIEEADIWI